MPLQQLHLHCSLWAEHRLDSCNSGGPGWIGGVHQSPSLPCSLLLSPATPCTCVQFHWGVCHLCGLLTLTVLERDVLTSGRNREDSKWTSKAAPGERMKIQFPSQYRPGGYKSGVKREKSYDAGGFLFTFKSHWPINHWCILFLWELLQILAVGWLQHQSWEILQMLPFLCSAGHQT